MSNNKDFIYIWKKHCKTVIKCDTRMHRQIIVMYIKFEKKNLDSGLIVYIKINNW